MTTAKNKITADTLRCERLRIATVKETGEKRRLARLCFNENWAILYGPVTEVKFDSKGIPVVFHDEDGAKKVPLDSITWEEVNFSDEVISGL